MKAVDICWCRARALQYGLSSLLSKPARLRPLAGRAVPLELNGASGETSRQWWTDLTLEGCGWRRGGAGESSLSWGRGFPIIPGCIRLHPVSWKECVSFGVGQSWPNWSAAALLTGRSLSDLCPHPSGGNITTNCVAFTERFVHRLEPNRPLGRVIGFKPNG